MKSRSRRGVSLIELMVVIAIISVLLSMVGVLFHRLFLSEQVSMRAALTERTISRLADQFRRDVHVASGMKRVEIDNGQTAKFELTESPEAGASPVVVYSIHAGEVLRELIVSGTVSSREVFRLPECLIRLLVPAEDAACRVAQPGD